MLSSEISLRTLVQNFKQFKSLFNIQSHEVNQFFERAFVKTSMSKRLTTLKWDHQQPHFAFTATTADLSTEKIESEAEKIGLETMFKFLSNLKKRIRKLYDIKVPHRTVEVRIVDIAWLNDHIPAFYKYLAAQEKSNIFDNEIIKFILKR